MSPKAKKKAMDGSHEFKEKRVQGLLRRIGDYESYFREIEKKSEDTEGGVRLDHPGTTAYINLVKLVLSITVEKEAVKAGNSEELRVAARKILKEVYGVER